jgi:hypothetical protein
MRGLFAALIALSLNGCNAHQPAAQTAEEIQEEARQAEVRRLADQNHTAIFSSRMKSVSGIPRNNSFVSSPIAVLQSKMPS